MSMQFKVKLAPAVSTAIVLPILMALGFWQLDRAVLKQEVLETYKARAAQAPTKLNSNDKPDSMQGDKLKYNHFEATGYYDVKHSFLIDNRVHQSQVGFYVITPFIIENSNNVVLVNRGWIKAKRYRSELPEFSTTANKIRINGMAYTSSKNFFAVENVKIQADSFPAIIQNVDFAAMKAFLKKGVYPFVLRLDAEDKSGFVRDWKVITSSPEKSQSYAAQWFTMAFIVVLLFLSSCFKFKREKTA